MLEDTKMCLSKFEIFLFIQNDTYNALMTSDHPGVSNTTMLGLGGDLGFKSVTLDDGTLLLNASEVLDRLFGDSDEATQLGLEMSSMFF